MIRSIIFLMVLNYLLPLHDFLQCRNNAIPQVPLKVTSPLIAVAVLNKNYPVIYLLDTDRSIGMVWNIIDWLEFADEMPPEILIGMAYKEDW